MVADLMGVSRRTLRGYRAAAGKAEVDRPRVAISVTHTHRAEHRRRPAAIVYSRSRRATDWWSTVHTHPHDQLESVAIAALRDRRPARLGWSQGRAGFAANRRVLKDGKWATFSVTPGGAADPDLPVLRFARAGRRGSRRYWSTTYHATPLEGRDIFVHGGWPGVRQGIIQQRHPGAVGAVTIGAGADSNPNPRGGGLADASKRTRKEIANEVDRVLKASERPSHPHRAVQFRYIDLSFAPLPARTRWEELAKKDNPGELPHPRCSAAARSQDHQITDDGALPRPDMDVRRQPGHGVSRRRGRRRLWPTSQARTRLVASVGERLCRGDVAFYVASQRLIPKAVARSGRLDGYYGQPARLADGTEDHHPHRAGIAPAAFPAPLNEHKYPRTHFQRTAFRDAGYGGRPVRVSSGARAPRAARLPMWVEIHHVTPLGSSMPPLRSP